MTKIMFYSKNLLYICRNKIDMEKYIEFQTTDKITAKKYIEARNQLAHELLKPIHETPICAFDFVINIQHKHVCMHAGKQLIDYRIGYKFQPVGNLLLAYTDLFAELTKPQ